MMKKSVLGAAIIIFLFPLSIFADETGWSHNIVGYIWGASQNGDTGIRNIQGPLGVDRDVISELDMGFDQILENLDSGAMLYYEGTNDKWGYFVDFIYMNISDDTDVKAAGINVAEVDVEAAETIFEFGIAYNVNPAAQLDVYGGIRYADVEVDIELAGKGPSGANRDFNAGDDWIDPFIGVRSIKTLSDKWRLLLRADIGGFGIASDFTWGALIGGSYSFNKKSSLKLIYRILDYDYDDNDFVFDVKTDGAGIGYGYRF